MQRNQWKAASAQLLKHWSRSGISQVPNTTAESQAKAVSWLESHASFVFEASDPAIHGANVDGLSNSQVTPPITANWVAEPSSQRQTVPIAPQSVTESSLERFAEPNPSVIPSSAPRPTTPIAAMQPGVVGVWNSKSLPILEREVAFDELNAQVVECRKCEEIVCRRQRTVFGVGALNARVVMFGEAPGADEDRLGEPFVGAAGQLLDKILVASGLKRPEVYILNSLKCRPPNNRTPAEAEIENCRPFFEAQLETIQPEYIVCWGAVAVRAVLGSTDSVGRLRGRFHSYRGAKVLVTYHPSYLLRTPDAKKLTWEDMKMLMKDMGLPIPGKS
ncbi:MAG: uracil-DNA glycosylase [Planctomycetota bacterium]|nr:uracil-DNA glycosylase [Planctomycetota bacterium]